MPMFSTEFEYDEKLIQYVSITNEKLQNNNVLINPFRGNIKVKENMLIVDMTPLYPNPVILGIFAVIPIIIFNGFQFSFWLVIPGLFLLGTIPHTSWFMFNALKRGAKRYGYTGKMKMISSKEVLRRIL